MFFYLAAIAAFSVWVVGWGAPVTDYVIAAGLLAIWTGPFWDGVMKLGDFIDRKISLRRLRRHFVAEVENDLRRAGYLRRRLRRLP